MEEAINNNDKLLVDLDGGYGYLGSFLEEAFEGLARIYGSNKVLEKIIIKSDEEKAWIDKINKYIKDANKK